MILACLYAVAGAILFAYHFPRPGAFHYEDIWIELTELLAFLLLQHHSAVFCFFFKLKSILINHDAKPRHVRAEPGSRTASKPRNCSPIQNYAGSARRLLDRRLCSTRRQCKSPYSRHMTDRRLPPSIVPLQTQTLTSAVTREESTSSLLNTRSKASAPAPSTPP